MNNLAIKLVEVFSAPTYSQCNLGIFVWLWFACLLLTGSTFADPSATNRGTTNGTAAPPAAAWTDPSYGSWHSCVIGGGGYLLNTVICPSDPKRIYVYGDMDGLFRSDDAGNTWRIIHGAMDVKEGRYEFAGLTVNPRNADEIAVACGSQSGPRQGVFLSSNGGKTWTKTLNVRFMGNGPFRWAGMRITGHCGPMGHIIAATEGTGVWRSANGGRTWQNCGLKGIFFTDVHFDRTNPNRIWLCAEPIQLDSGEFSHLLGGEYRSEDGGATWTKLADESPFEIVQDPIKANVLYGLCDSTVKRSIDLGTTWQDCSEGLPVKPNDHLGADPFRAIGAGPDFILVVQNDSKIIYRLDSGQSHWQRIVPAFKLAGWRFSNFSPPANDASSIAVSPLDRSHWYLTDEFGIYQSWNAGRTWKPSNQGIETTVIHAITQNPANVSEVYLGAADVGFWWSNDAGAVLNETTSSSAGWVGNIKCIDASVKLPSRIYAVGGPGWKSESVYLSTDKGVSVSLLTTHGTGLPKESFSCESIVVDPNDPYSVYLATSAVISAASGGVYHSRDGGNSWVWMGLGLPRGTTVFQDNIWWGGRELAMGPDSTLLAISASRNSVYRFDRSSNMWAAVNLTHVGGLYSITADLLTPGRFYVCVIGNESHLVSAEGGLFRTDDSGMTWKKILTGSVHAVAIDRGVKGRVAASNTQGIFFSTDGGNTWMALEKLPNRWVNDCLAFAGNRVVVGTGGNGAFWIDLRRLTPGALTNIFPGR